MTTRIALAAGGLLLAAAALWHPVPHPAFQSLAPAASPLKAPSDARRSKRGSDRYANATDAVVYVAGAVARPGLYHVRADQRVADAIVRAGGLGAAADAAAVDLAGHVADGEEIFVPAAGQTTRSHPRSFQPSRGRTYAGRSRGTRAPIELQSIDVNVAGGDELARVPGIGRSIGARIVELRERDGTFATLDELLDVSGMTQTRLERARPFLRALP